METRPFFLSLCPPLFVVKSIWRKSNRLYRNDRARIFKAASSQARFSITHFPIWHVNCRNVINLCSTRVNLLSLSLFLFLSISLRSSCNLSYWRTDRALLNLYGPLCPPPTLIMRVDGHFEKNMIPIKTFNRREFNSVESSDKRFGTTFNLTPSFLPVFSFKIDNNLGLSN